jgi:hypothetical protein
VSGLFPAELDLTIASLILAYAIYEILESDLLGIRAPRVRKYGILGNIAAKQVLGQAEFAFTIKF